MWLVKQIVVWVEFDSDGGTHLVVCYTSIRNLAKSMSPQCLDKVALTPEIEVNDYNVLDICQ